MTLSPTTQQTIQEEINLLFDFFAELDERERQRKEEEINRNKESENLEELFNELTAG